MEKTFGATPALRGVDFGISRAETVAIVGPSGSGKSTLLLCLAGVLRPDSGSVSLDGRNLQELSDRDLTRLRRTDFGLLFQFGQLLNELPAVENVALPLLLEGVRRKAAMRQATDMLAQLEVKEVAGKRPEQLSGGQSQRVALARALVTKPRIVFADEPTGALDRAAGDLVLNLLRSAAERLGTAVILVTHDLDVAQRADRILEIVDGRVATDPPVGIAR